MSKIIKLVRPASAHKRMHALIERVQDDLEKLVIELVDQPLSENDTGLMDKYALAQNALADLRAASIDHAYVANAIHWKQS